MSLRVRILRRRPGFTLDAAFELPTPGIVALFGRSGCGKTTTIDVIAGLARAEESRVELDGQVLEDSQSGLRVPAEQRRIGYVFQDARLFPHLTVASNLLYGRRRARAQEREIAFDPVVALLGLEALLPRRPHQLSGGERQRVALGRAILSQPRLLLLDEPLASLDVARREEVLPYLEALRDTLSIPMVYVSHQFDEVLRLATHVVLMDAGRILAQGPLNTLSLRPEFRAIVGSEAAGAVLEGEIISVDRDAGLAQISLGTGVMSVSMPDAVPRDRVRIQLLARDVILATEEPRGLSVRNEIRGRVAELSSDDGNSILVSVDIGGATVLARVTRRAVAALGLQPGREVWVLVKAMSTRGHAFRHAR